MKSITTTLIIVISLTASLAASSVDPRLTRHLPTSTCSKLQHDLQKAILTNDWSLQNVQFQKRLKLHPQYIVTIQNVVSSHDPLIELRCPGGGGTTPTTTDKLTVYFHESRFAAKSVNLFDIQSIFPIHSGAMSVKINVPRMVITLRGSDLTRNVDNIQFDHTDVDHLQRVSLHNITVVFGLPWQRVMLILLWQQSVSRCPNCLQDEIAKHREQDAASAADFPSGIGDDAADARLLSLEKEIESVFVKRILPDIQKQIKNIVTETANNFFASNIAAF
jgi:hypothetical protein